MRKQKKRGCLGRLFHTIWTLIKCVLITFGIVLVVILFGIYNDKKASNTITENLTTVSATEAPSAEPTTSTTETPTAEPTSAPTTTPTAEPTIEPTATPLKITLRHPELGEYGRYYTMNEKVKKAEAEDKETLIQCFVPAGRYTVKNAGEYPTFVYIYSEETVISEAGWEEPAEGQVSEFMKAGDTCEITVPEGHYINLQENNVFELELMQ